MVSRYFFILVFLASALLARADGLTCTFVAPPQPIAPGQRVIVWLYCMNESDADAVEDFAPSLKGEIAGGFGTVKTLLGFDESSGSTHALIAPKSFARRSYSFDAPQNISGAFRLEVPDYGTVALKAAPPAEAASVPPPAPATNTPAPPSNHSEMSTASKSSVRDFFSEHISGYEPIYFILGSYPAAEFQFSLKYQILSLSNQDNALNDWYFAYTQTSFWDLLSSDPKFYDTSYKPSTFFYFRDIFNSKDQKFTRVDFQSGFEHESNGKGGADERSLNTVYMQPTLTLGPVDHVMLTLQPRAWLYTGVGGNNPDLPAYRGYADMRAALTWSGPKDWESVQFATRFREGNEGSHSSLMFDLRVGLWRILGINPSLQVQYFTGYGQTLRQYNQDSHGIRAGLCLWY
jgi:outer membrane phospholipase A